MKYLEVCLLDDPFEGDIVTGALAQEDIPFQLISRGTSGLDQMYDFKEAWGVILVPENEVGRAMAVIKASLEATPVEEDNLEGALAERPPAGARIDQ